MNHKVILAIYLLSIVLQLSAGQTITQGNSTGLRCYECTNCWYGDRLQENQAELQMCKPGFNYCLKAYIGRYLVRSCSPTCEQTGFRVTGAVGGTFCCNTDSCNSSNQILNNLALVIVGTLFSLFFTRA